MKKSCRKILGSPVSGYYPKCDQLWMGELTYCENCNKDNNGLENDEYHSPVDLKGGGRCG